MTYHNMIAAFWGNMKENRQVFHFLKNLRQKGGVSRNRRKFRQLNSTPSCAIVR